MKPQEKIVTAQDVQNSLYYLHVDSPDDYQHLRDQNEDGELPEAPESTQPDLYSNNSIHRKPLLPKRDRPSKAAESPLAAIHLQSRTNGVDNRTEVSRKPFDQNVRPGHKSFDSAPALPPRKLIGPRSMRQRLYSANNSALQDVSGRQNVDMRRWSEQPNEKQWLPPRVDPSSGKDNRIALQERERRSTEIPEKEARRFEGSGASAEHCWEWEKSWETERANEARAEMPDVTSAWQNDQGSRQDSVSPFQATSLTLIRRYDGEQWNVAKMKENGCAPQPDADVESGFLIDVLTPGYSMFAYPNNSQKVHDVEEVIFRRRLQLSKKNHKQRNAHTPEVGEFRVSEENSRPSFESRQASLDSFATGRDHLPINLPAVLRGCSLESPWNGICEFSTGLAGRSLKCKHLYSSLNPDFGPGIFSASVSELRFNLPSSKVFGTPNPKSPVPGAPRENKRSSRFLLSHHRQSSSYFERDAISFSEGHGTKVELEDRLDLSLGQEHAGGGFGGKQAKLGKLIIEIEGLQMLDLIVAANMALWWRVYERTT